jgi:ABC-type phosphate/phosphonate transport system substrate-binding protein
MVRKDLDPTVRQRLQETLLKTNDNPAAASVLRTYQKTKRFDKLSKDQKEAIYNLSSVIQMVDEAVVW